MEALAVGLATEAVKFLFERFIQQLNEHTSLILGAGVMVADLRNDLKFLTEKLASNSIERSLLEEVRDSVYKAEDAIDFLVMENESKSFPGGILRSKPGIAQSIKSVSESVAKIRHKVEEHEREVRRATQSEGIPVLAYKGPPRKQAYGGIFMEEEKRLRASLTREGEGEEADVIFITGTHGIGKTALAAKMFHDSAMTHFTKRIWVSLPEPTAKNIFLVVLRQLNQLPQDSQTLSNEWELSQLVATHLTRETFLVVLDDVPQMNAADRDSLRWAFQGNDKKMSKVLITTTNDNLAPNLGRRDSDITLSTLTDAESWSLLEWRVFSGGRCPVDLVSHGEAIATNCYGLPQKIIFAGDALAEGKDRYIQDPVLYKTEWQDFSVDMVSFTPSSYYNMPYYLRLCFLYLGIFPQKSKFSVSKLTHMWIAEGFIPRRPTVTMEKTAQEYLKDLIHRNLVKVEEKRLDGSAKTCSINQLLWDFCKRESETAQVNFFQEFQNSTSEGFYPPVNEVARKRRVSVHSHVSKFIPHLFSSNSRGFEIGLHSFVSHADKACHLRKKDSSKIRPAFTLLRVFDAKPIEVKKFHSDLCKLFFLRYVTLSLNGDVLSAAISKLQNLQTLIVHTTSPTLKIEADILKMALKHFKTDASATFPKQSSASEEDERLRDKTLQTLCGVSPKSCTPEFFCRTPNMRKLGVRGQLDLLLDGNNELLRSLVRVDTLKLSHIASPKEEVKWSRFFQQPRLPLSLSSLLQPSQLPPTLSSLTLSATSLNWQHISVLGSLETLKELKLKNNAFVGEKWEVSGKGFPHLQTLHIERVDFIQWRASSGQFQQLRRLMLSECKELREIPIELANVRTFGELHLHNCNKSAAESAWKIDGEKQRKRRTDSSTVFMLFT